MDPYTEKLIERSRQRREILNQKLGKTPDPTPRKRRTPLAEDYNINANTEQQQNDESPKRPCLREAENEVKCDTPAIVGVRSRMNQLSRERGQWGEPDDTEISTVVPVRDTTDENAAPVISTPGTRRGRLAALAQNINNWEDDLSHAKLQHEEAPVSSPKKYRAPVPPSPPVVKKWSPVKSPAKVTSPTKFPSSTTTTTPTKFTSRTVTASPTKTLPLTPQIRVPQNQYDNRMPVEQIPVNAKGLNESPTASEQTDDEPTAKPVSERFSKWVEKTGTPKSKRPLDPTQTPVSARMANWAQRVDTPAVRPSSKSAGNVDRVQTPCPNITSQVSAASHKARPISMSSIGVVNSPAPVARPVSMATDLEDPTTRPVAERMAKWQEHTKPVEQEPTAYTVGARMSAWETMSSANKVSYIKKINPGEHPASPKFSPARLKKGMTPSKCVQEAITEKAQQIMANNAGTPGVKSCPLSPNSVSGTMKTVHQRLMEQTHNSTKSQDVMEKMRKERMAELDTIQNRWKNGILREDGGASSSNEQSTPKPSATPSKSHSKPSAKPVTPCKETIRSRARDDFDNKLASMGFDLSHEGDASFDFKKGGTPRSYNQKVKEQNSINEQPPPAGCIPAPPPIPTQPAQPGPPRATQPGPPKGNSIYSIISKEPSFAKPTQARPVMRHASTNSRKVQFEDSFDSTDDNNIHSSIDEDVESPSPSESDFESEVSSVEMRPKPMHRPAPPVYEEDDSSVEMRSKPMHRPAPPVYEEDDVSLSAFVSDSVRRQSILPAAPHDEHMPNYPSETSDDEPQRTRYRSPHHSRTRLQVPTESSSSITSSDRGDIDDLLDEAMDSEDEERAPMPKPRHKRYDSSDSDHNLIYSVSAYRSRRNLQVPNSAGRISRHSAYVESGVQEEDIEMPHMTPQRPDRKSLQERMQELQELVQQEQNVIMQTSNALNQCCGRDSHFNGSAEQVECNRLLLVACQKRQSYMAEIQRLKSEGTLEACGPGPKGSLTISDIRLPLKKEFVTKIGTMQDMTTYFFMILIRKDTQVICTQMLSTHDPMMRGSLDFPNLIKMNGITGDFKLHLEIYGMSVSKEVNPKDKKKQKTPKKSKFPMPLQSPGGPNAVRTTSFSHITSVPITMKSLDKSCFNLERLPYLSPLHGSIYLRLKCLMEVSVEERGFLTMFEDVSGLGAWHRRWVVLARNKLSFWKYPDDENRKDPMGVIDLKRCITEKVGLIPRDICARPHTFELMIVRQPRQGERDTLVSRTYNTMTTVKYMLSADTKEERIVWCNKVNRNLANMRAWHSDALPPVRIPSKQS